jgi:hypothetical protein
MTQAIPARAFVESLGVNVHVGYTDTIYGNLPKMIEALKYAGLTKVRDGHVPWQNDRYAAMAKAGVRFDFFLPGGVKEIPDPATFVRNVSAFAKANPGAVVSIEGSNEVNNWPFGADRSLAGQGAVQKALWAAVKADPVLSGLPVYAPSVTNAGAAQGLGDLRAACTHANAHIYFGEGAVTPRGNSFWRDTIAYNQAPAQGKPTVITETGYSTNVNGPQGCDETTQAKHTLKLLMDAAKEGIAATFLYELVDQMKPGSDPGSVDRERRFGLFRNDWTPKPVATGIRNVVGVIGAGQGRAIMTLEPQLDYALSFPLASAGKPPTPVYDTLFALGDGSFVIAIWAEPDIWDEAGNKPVTAHTFTCEVKLPRSMTWEVFDPLVSDKAVTFGNTGTARARVCDHPVLVKIRP